jgi:hypothetical protein
MRTIEYYQYTLISSHVPEIINSQIKNGLLYGGIKLTYTKQKIMSKEIKFRSIRILIPIQKASSKEVTFLRPFKKLWNVKKHKLTPNHYGKRKSPYLNIWCELSNGNYTNITIASKINTLVRHIIYPTVDKTFVSYLNNKSKSFRIEIVNY